MRTQRGAANSNWRGGRRRGGQGQRYWTVYAPEHPAAHKTGVVLEHRLVMEAALGRYLTEDEVVHHINEDTLDNRIENLRLMSRAEHARLHYGSSLQPHAYIRPPAIRLSRVCERCGCLFEVVGKKERGRRFCSQRCYWDYRIGTGQLQKGCPA